MYSRVALLAAALLNIASLGYPAYTAAAAPTFETRLLRNVRLFDGHNEPVSGVEVLIVGDRIVESGAYPDLLLINGDPLADISILSHPESCSRSS